jgi:hypothetical protein
LFAASTLLPLLLLPAAVRAGRTQLTKKDMYAGVDRFTQVGKTQAWFGFGQSSTCMVLLFLHFSLVLLIYVHHSMFSG